MPEVTIKEAPELYTISRKMITQLNLRGIFYFSQLEQQFESLEEYFAPKNLNPFNSSWLDKVSESLAAWENSECKQDIFFSRVKVRKGKYFAEDIIPHIISPEEKIVLHGDVINVTSVRLQTFTQNLVCVDCGVRGVYFTKDRALCDKGYHINLYGINANGNEVLMTKDHIMPRSKGGSDTLDNMQTMCCKCNEKKGNSYESATVGTCN